MTEHSDRVREMAYFLWLEEGCPEGEAERDWLAAKTLLEPLEASQARASLPASGSEVSRQSLAFQARVLRSRYLAGRS